MNKVFQPHIQLKLSKDFIQPVMVSWCGLSLITCSSCVRTRRYFCACTGEHICSHACAHTQDTTLHLKLDVRQKADVLGILPEVVHESAVVHVVGKMLRNGEVTETHHFLWSVDGHRFVDTRHFLWQIFLEEETPQCNKILNYKVIKHFKWCQVFLKSGTLLLYIVKHLLMCSPKILCFLEKESHQINHKSCVWLLNQNNGCQKREYCFSNGKSKMISNPNKNSLKYESKIQFRANKSWGTSSHKCYTKWEGPMHSQTLPMSTVSTLQVYLGLTQFYVPALTKKIVIVILIPCTVQ